MPSGSGARRRWNGRRPSAKPRTRAGQRRSGSRRRREGRRGWRGRHPDRRSGSGAKPRRHARRRSGPDGRRRRHRDSWSNRDRRRGGSGAEPGGHAHRWRIGPCVKRTGGIASARPIGGQTCRSSRTQAREMPLDAVGDPRGDVQIQRLRAVAGADERQPAAAVGKVERRTPVCTARDAVDVDPGITGLNAQQDVALPAPGPWTHGRPIGGAVIGSRIIRERPVGERQRANEIVDTEGAPVPSELSPRGGGAGPTRRWRDGSNSRDGRRARSRRWAVRSRPQGDRTAGHDPEKSKDRFRESHRTKAFRDLDVE